MRVGELRARDLERRTRIEIDGGVDGGVAVGEDDPIMTRAGVNGIARAHVERIIAVGAHERLRRAAFEAVHDDVDVAGDGGNDSGLGRAEEHGVIDGFVGGLNDQIEMPVVKLVKETFPVVFDDVMHHPPRGASVEQLLQQRIDAEVLNDRAVAAEQIGFVGGECLNAEARGRIPKCMSDRRDQSREEPEGGGKRIAALLDRI